MDMRYLLIIVLIVFSSISLFFIADNSDVIGSASVNVKNFTFSMPAGMDVLNSYEDRVELHSSKNGFYAAVYVLNENNYNLTKIVGDIQNKHGNTILSNGTINVNGIMVDSIYYKSESNGYINNRSTFFFVKDNTAFNIAISTFNYDNDRNLTLDFVTYVVDTLRVNHKK